MRRMFDRKELGGGELKPASSTKLGGVKAVGKGEEMTQPIGIDNNGFLWTKESAGGGGSAGYKKLSKQGKKINPQYTVKLQDEVMKEINNYNFLIIEFNMGWTGEANSPFSILVPTLAFQKSTPQYIMSFKDTMYYNSSNNSINTRNYALTITQYGINFDCNEIIFKNDNTFSIRNLNTLFDNRCEITAVYGC